VSRARAWVWLALAAACEEGQQAEEWFPTPTTRDSGDLSWSPSGVRAAVGQPVSVTVTLELSLTTCAPPGAGCSESEDECNITERTPSIEPLRFTCEGAGCSIASVARAGSAVELTVSAAEPGRAVLRGAARDTQTGEAYGGTAHIDFFDAETIALLRHPVVAPGSGQSVLAGSVFEWCALVQGTDTDGTTVNLSGAPTLSASTTIEVGSPYGGVPNVDPPELSCFTLTAFEPGTATVEARFGALARQVTLTVASADAAVGASIRQFDAITTLPTWLPVEEDVEAGFSAPLDRLAGRADQAYFGLLVSALSFADGTSAPGGVGAITVGPSGVAILEEASLDARSGKTFFRFGPPDIEATAPLVTRHLFTIQPRKPGQGELRLAVGAADLRLPIEVTASAEAGGLGAGGAAGDQGGAGGHALGGATNAAAVGGEAGESGPGDAGHAASGGGGTP